jgi:hypothetical protein
MGEKRDKRRTSCMIRIHVICEGHTEAMFVKGPLAQSLMCKNIFLIPSLIGVAGHKGGNFKLDRLVPDVKNRLLGDTNAFCSTFFDFYALHEDFPGRKEANKQRNIADKAECIQNALVEYFQDKIGSDAVRRFIPYVQMHEFEGLLFSDPVSLAKSLHNDDLASKFEFIRKQFPTPEDINDNYKTAPSKRIMELYPSFRKPLDGLQAACKASIDTIRKECQLFNQWLTCMEMLRS